MTALLLLYLKGSRKHSSGPIGIAWMYVAILFPPTGLDCDSISYLQDVAVWLVVFIVKEICGWQLSCGHVGPRGGCSALCQAAGGGGDLYWHPCHKASGLFLVIAAHPLVVQHQSDRLFLLALHRRGPHHHCLYEVSCMLRCVSPCVLIKPSENMTTGSRVSGGGNTNLW